MKKNKIYTNIAILFLFNQNSFALENKIQLSNSYLENISSENNDFIDLNKDVKLNSKDLKVKIIKEKNKQYFDDNEINNVFDEKFKEFIKEHQLSVKLNPTGILDKNTWYSLYEQPINWQKEKIFNSIEQWKNILEKVSKQEEKYFIVVNIPNMKLEMYDKNNLNEPILDSKVIVGQTNKKTPFDDLKIIGIKYNPTWTPTPSMLKEHSNNGVLDSSWIKKNNLKVYDKNGNKITGSILRTDVASIMQASGDNNALGKLKFETNSRENIYLHDTNKRNLFDFNSRTFSSGCIRVQNYLQIASLIEEKTEEEILENINKNKTYIKKVNPVAVYFSHSQVDFFKNNENQYSIIFAPNIYNK